MLESVSSLQLGLVGIGALVLGGVALYNHWSSRKNLPRQAEPQTENSRTTTLSEHDALQPLEPALIDEFVHLPQFERKPQLDPLIDAMASIEVDHPVSGDAALAALPVTRRIGTKPFHVEGCSELSGEWEVVVLGRRYSAFQAGVQLVTRVGALNNIEFSEFVVKTQAFADAVGGNPNFSDMIEEVARARELDQFASAYDAQLSFTVCARASAWSPGYIQQHAARLGFVAGAMPGRMVLPSAVAGLPPALSLTFDTQAALADDPALSAIREFSLSLDVPQIAREEQPFQRLCEAALWLAQHMDGVLTDGNARILGKEVLDQIAKDLEQLYSALSAHGLSAGSPQARRLFS
jgi:hypothetical protein